jgi:hypothetical protein
VTDHLIGSDRQTVVRRSQGEDGAGETSREVMTTITREAMMSR